MGISIKINNKTRSVLINGHGQKFIKNGIRKSLHEIGKFLQKDIQEGIKRPPKTGRYYKYKGRRKRASIGSTEYPANRSGKLRRSINFKVEGSRRMILGAKANYGIYLEDGTLNMEKRKLLEFTINKRKNIDNIKNILRKNVDQEFK